MESEPTQAEKPIEPILEVYFDAVGEWAVEKGVQLYPQLLKIGEEYGELCAAVLKRKDRETVEDAVGDTLFTVIAAARLIGVDPVESLRKVCKTVFARSGSTVEGSFVRSEDPAPVQGGGGPDRAIPEPLDDV